MPSAHLVLNIHCDDVAALGGVEVEIPRLESIHVGGYGCFQ